MKRFLKYFKGAWPAVFLAPAMMIFEVLCDLMQPSIMADIVDVGLNGGAGSAYILKEGIKMMGIALVGFVGGFGSLFFATKASQHFGYNLRKDVFHKIQEFSFSNIDHFSGASLVTRTTNDVVTLITLVGMALRMLIRAPMTFAGGIFHAIRINATLALILAVAIPLLLVAVLLIVRKTFPLFSQVQYKLDRVNAVIQENLTGIRVVKAFDRAQHEDDRFGEANNEYVQLSIKANQIMSFMMPIITMIMNVSVIAVLWFGAKLVGAEEMEVGQVSAFIQYITRILSSLMMMSMMFMSISRAQASASRIAEVLDEKIDIVSPEEPKASVVREGGVEFKNVSFRYRDAGGDPAIQDISFTARPGETVAILGSTGSGKSTLVNLIPRLYDVTEGEVLVDGINVKDYDVEGLREGIGMVLQDVILFTGTIADNLRWGKDDATDEEIREAAAMAQAEEFIEKNPDKYNAILGQRGVNFSGGQKQRLSIARALIKKPKILILDDSTSAVDTATEARIRSCFGNQLKGTTVIIIAQRISSARGADKILVMENGRIVDSGNHETLMRTSEVYREIYYSQLEKEEA